MKNTDGFELGIVPGGSCQVPPASPYNIIQNRYMIYNIIWTIFEIQDWVRDRYLCLIICCRQVQYRFWYQQSVLPSSRPEISSSLFEIKANKLLMVKPVFFRFLSFFNDLISNHPSLAWDLLAIFKGSDCKLGQGRILLITDFHFKSYLNFIDLWFQVWENIFCHKFAWSLSFWRYLAIK